MGKVVSSVTDAVKTETVKYCQEFKEAVTGPDYVFPGMIFVPKDYFGFETGSSLDELTLF